MFGSKEMQISSQSLKLTADIEIRFDKECAGFSSWYQDALRQD